MANLDYTIASGIRPIQLESPMNQLAQAYQLKSMQEASQMNALRMQELQREARERNALRALNPASSTYIQDIQKISPELGFKYRKLQSEAESAALNQQKEKSALFDAKLKQSRQFLEGIDPNSPTAAAEYIKWHEANHADPVLGPILAARGVTADVARAHIDQAIKTGRLADLIDQSKLGIEKFAELSPNYKKAKEEEFNTAYSEYLDIKSRTGDQDIMSRAEFRAKYFGSTAIPTAKPIGGRPAEVKLAEPVVNLAPAPAPETVDVPRKSEIGNAIVQRLPNYNVADIQIGLPPAEVKPAEVKPTEVKPTEVKPVAGAVSSKDPTLSPLIAALLSSKDPGDNRRGQALLELQKLTDRDQKAQSEIAQMQADRAAAIKRGDKKAANEIQQAINKRLKDDSPIALSSIEYDLISKAITDGRLDPGKVNSRNARIIANTLAKDPTVNLKELNIDAMAGGAASKALATQSAKILAAANEADSMINIVRTTAAKIDRTQYPSINAIENAVSKGTGGKDIVALNTAINALINSYARAINPTGVATVSDKNHAREIINSNYASGQLNAILDVMKEEMRIAKQSPGEASRQLKEERNKPVPKGGLLAPPPGFKLDK